MPNGPNPIITLDDIAYEEGRFLLKAPGISRLPEERWIRELSPEEVGATLLRVGDRSAKNQPARLRVPRSNVYIRASTVKTTPSAKVFGKEGLFYFLRLEDIVFLLDLCRRNSLGWRKPLNWELLRWLLTQSSAPRNLAEVETNAPSSKFCPNQAAVDSSSGRLNTKNHSFNAGVCAGQNNNAGHSAAAGQNGSTTLGRSATRGAVLSQVASVTRAQLTTPGYFSTEDTTSLAQASVKFAKSKDTTTSGSISAQGLPPALSAMPLQVVLQYRARMLPYITDEVFAFLINFFETLTGVRPECVALETAFAEARTALGLLTPSQNILREVYSYWKLRRFCLGRPLLRMFWPVPAVNDSAPFAVFRARTKEKMVLRRPRRSAAESASRLTRLCAELERSVRLFRGARLRDWLKLQLCDLDALLFEQLWKERSDKTYQHGMWIAFRKRLAEEVGAPRSEVNTEQNLESLYLPQQNQIGRNQLSGRMASSPTTGKSPAAGKNSFAVSAADDAGNPPEIESSLELSDEFKLFATNQLTSRRNEALADMLTVSPQTDISDQLFASMAAVNDLEMVATVEKGDLLRREPTQEALTSSRSKRTRCIKSRGVPNATENINGPAIASKIGDGFEDVGAPVKRVRTETFSASGQLSPNIQSQNTTVSGAVETAYTHVTPDSQAGESTTLAFISPVPLPPIYLCLVPTMPLSVFWSILASAGVRRKVVVGYTELPANFSFEHNKSHSPQNAAPAESGRPSSKQFSSFQRGKIPSESHGLHTSRETAPASDTEDCSGLIKNGRLVPIFAQALEALPLRIRHPRNLRLIVPFGPPALEATNPATTKSENVKAIIRTGRSGRVWLDRYAPCGRAAMQSEVTLSRGVGIPLNATEEPFPAVPRANAATAAHARHWLRSDGPVANAVRAAAASLVTMMMLGNSADKLSGTPMNGPTVRCCSDRPKGMPCPLFAHPTAHTTVGVLTDNLSGAENALRTYSLKASGLGCVLVPKEETRPEPLNSLNVSLPLADHSLFAHDPFTVPTPSISDGGTAGAALALLSLSQHAWRMRKHGEYLRQLTLATPCYNSGVHQYSDSATIAGAKHER